MTLNPRPLVSSLGAHGVGKEVGVGELDAVLEFGGVGPAEGFGLGDVEELARGSVGSGRIPLYFAGVANNLCYKFCEFFYGEFFAGTCVHGFITTIVVK